MLSYFLVLEVWEFTEQAAVGASSTAESIIQFRYNIKSSFSRRQQSLYVHSRICQLVVKLSFRVQDEELIAQISSPLYLSYYACCHELDFSRLSLNTFDKVAMLDLYTTYIHTYIYTSHLSRHITRHSYYFPFYTVIIHKINGRCSVQMSDRGIHLK